MAKRLYTLVILGVLLIGTSNHSSPATAFASDYHVDPDSVPTLFSGSALLHHYAGTLNYVIQMDPESTRENLVKMPFAEIPHDLTGMTNDFTSATISLSEVLKEAYAIWDERNELLVKVLYREARALSDIIERDINDARIEIGTLKSRLTRLGEYFDIANAPPQSALTVNYFDVEGKIARLESMLDLLAQSLDLSDLNIENQQTLEFPTLAISVTPGKVFVGDLLHFQISLMVSGQPLTGRQVDLTLDGETIITITTDMKGNCEGDFKVPYKYVPSIQIRAFFAPTGQDAGIFAAALSAPADIDILYYTVTLVIELENTPHPGLEMRGKGILQYEDSVAFISRTFDIFFDGIYNNTQTAETSFTISFMVDPLATIGDHALTIIVPAAGRYAPAYQTLEFEVTRVTPVILLNLPRTIWIPSNLEVSGNLSSEFGPLSGASLILAYEHNYLTAISGLDGNFIASGFIKPDLALFGKYNVTIAVSPVEPWNSTVELYPSVFVINYLNCGIAGLLLGLFGVYLPRHLSRRFGLSSRNIVSTPSGTGRSPVLNDFIPSGAAVAETTTGDASAPRNVIFSLYLRLISYFQRLGVPAPVRYMTLREYALAIRQIPIGAQQHFVEFTRLVERFVYGPRSPAEDDVAKSARFANDIREEIEL